MTEPKKYKAPALAKGLEVLELLSGSDVPLSLSEMTGHLGRSRNEIFRMVQELEDHDYIRRASPSDGYEITEKMFLLSVQRPKTTTLLEAALPEMRAFARLTGHSVHVAIMSEDKIVVIARIEGEGPVSFSVRVGHTQKMFDSTSGIVQLAYQPGDITEMLTSRFKERFPEFDANKLVQEMKTAREAGVCVRAGRFVEGITDVSAPIIRGGRAVAALTSPCVSRIGQGPSLPIDELIDAAFRISDIMRDQ